MMQEYDALFVPLSPSADIEMGGSPPPLQVHSESARRKTRRLKKRAAPYDRHGSPSATADILSAALDTGSRLRDSVIDEYGYHLPDAPAATPPPTPAAPDAAAPTSVEAFAGLDHGHSHTLSPGRTQDPTPVPNAASSVAPDPPLALSRGIAEKEQPTPGPVSNTKHPHDPPQTARAQTPTAPTAPHGWASSYVATQRALVDSFTRQYRSAQYSQLMNQKWIPKLPDLQDDITLQGIWYRCDTHMRRLKNASSAQMSNTLLKTITSKLTSYVASMMPARSQPAYEDIFARLSEVALPFLAPSNDDEGRSDRILQYYAQVSANHLAEKYGHPTTPLRTDDDLMAEIDNMGRDSFDTHAIQSVIIPMIDLAVQLHSDYVGGDGDDDDGAFDNAFDGGRPLSLA